MQEFNGTWAHVYMDLRFAGIANERYLRENTCMLFGGAKDSVGKIVQKLKG